MGGLPLSWSELTPEEKARVQDNYAEKSVWGDLVRYENGVFMPRVFAEELADRIYNMKLRKENNNSIVYCETWSGILDLVVSHYNICTARKDDIWILSYPKCGTTWAIETVWMVMNDVRIETANSPQMARVPYLESYAMIDHTEDSKAKTVEMKELLDDPLAFADNIQGRRFFKSHLPFDFLPPKLLETCKVIYVSRNPKDAANSFYHWMPGFNGTYESFMDMFLGGEHVYGNFFSHLLGGWKNIQNPNLKFIWFEDMKKDQMSIIRDLCTFLDHPLTEEQIVRLADHLKFDDMKKNPHCNPTAGVEWHGGDFMRKGEVGDWRNYFSQEMLTLTELDWSF